MSAINISSYKKLYLQTAAENCDGLLKSCSQILQDASDIDALQNVYINAHSLRSKSQVMGYSKIAQLSGMIEKEVKKFLDEKEAAPKDVISGIREKTEKIRELIRSEDNIRDAESGLA